MVFVLLLVGWAVGASAQNRITVVVQPQNVFCARAAALLEQFGVSRITREAGFEALPIDVLLASAAGGRETKSFLEAREVMKRGLEFYENLDLDSAIIDLTEAVEKFESVPAELERDRERNHLLALTYLGAALILKGEPEKGQGTFRRLLTFDRRVQLDKNVFPPSLLETFKSVSNDIGTGPSAPLAISSIPSFGKVFVDGTFRGVTPLTLDRLPTGEHLVVVRTGGFFPFGKKVKVEEPEGANLNWKLTPVQDQESVLEQLAQAVRELEDDEPLPENVRNMLVQRGIKTVVLGRIDGKGAELKTLWVFFDLASGKPVRAHEAELNENAAGFQQDADAIFSYLITGRQDVLTAAKQRSPGDSAPLRLRDEELFEEQQVPLYKKWWFWTAIGAGAAVATVLLVLLVPRGSEPESKILLEF
jgi:hypothetical protein